MRPVLLLLVLGLGTLPARAAQLVQFDDGRALRVARATPQDDGTLLLEFEGGGGAAVGGTSVTGIRDIVDPPAEPDVTAVPALAEEYRKGERWREAAGPYADLIAEVADRHGLERALLAAVAQVESRFDPFAVSPKGACGLMQLMPATAKRFGVTELFDASQSAEGGARYLRWLLDRFEGRIDLALAGYNAGEGAVDRHGGIPPYRETLRYVGHVLEDAARHAE